MGEAFMKSVQFALIIILYSINSLTLYSQKRSMYINYPDISTGYTPKVFSEHTDGISLESFQFNQLDGYNCNNSCFSTNYTALHFNSKILYKNGDIKRGICLMEKKGELLSSFSKITMKNLNYSDTIGSDTLNSTINHLGLYYDPGMTTRTGTDNVLLLHHGFSRLEDKIIGIKWTSENTFLKKSAGILGRFAKYVFLDIPVNFLFHIGNHEFFGHGARYREFDLGKIDYHLEPPFPYGVGGGYANVSSYSREVSDHERIAIWQSGFEAHDILNRR